MMGTDGISGVSRSLKKKLNAFKSYGIIYILRQRQRPGAYCIFTTMVASPYAKEVNKVFSSTKSRSK